MVGWLRHFSKKLIRSKIFWSMITCILLAYIFNGIFLPLSFIFVLAAYFCGAMFIFWLFSSLIPE